MRIILYRKQPLHQEDVASNSVSPEGSRGTSSPSVFSFPLPHACPVYLASLCAAVVYNCLGNSMYQAMQMSDAGSCPKGRRMRTVNKDLGVLHFGVPAVSFTLFTLNYSGSALSNYKWSTPATSHSCSTTTLMTTSVIQRERVKTHL